MFCGEGAYLPIEEEHSSVDAVESFLHINLCKYTFSLIFRSVGRESSFSPEIKRNDRWIAYLSSVWQKTSQFNMTYPTSWFGN